MVNAVQVPQRRKALASIKKGVLDTPVRALIYGAEKVGKSTFAAGAPSPVFLGAENGTERLDVERLQPSTWEEASSWIDELATEKHEYKTLVVDPINWLEPLCWIAVVGDSGQSIEDYGGGYGKGHVAALGRWREFVFGLEKCWRRGMNVVIVAHSQVRTFQNPEGPAFDRYELAMNVKASGLLKQWVDAVLFARLETFTKVDPGTKKARGYSSGARVIHTQPCAAYDAGARWKLPEEIPLSWSEFWDAVQAETHRGPELIAQIAKLVDELADDKIANLSMAYVEKHKANADRLAELVNRLNLKLDEKKKESAVQA